VFAFCLNFVFAGCLLKELVDTFHFSFFLSVPASGSFASGRDCYKYSAKRRRSEITQLSVLGKGCVVLVLLVRTAIIAGLLFWGMRFIGTTVQVMDFVLDVLALIFILHFDEAFLYAFGTPSLQHAVRVIEIPTPNDDLKLMQLPLVPCILAAVLASFSVYQHTRVQIAETFRIKELCTKACTLQCFDG